MQFFWHFFATTHPSTAELMLFKHMLATPLTSLQLSLHDSQSPHTAPLRQQKWAVQAHTALARVSDIMAFFTNPQAISRENILLEPFFRELKHLFSGSHQQLNCTLLLPKGTQRQIVGNRFLLEEALICLVKNGFESYNSEDNKHVAVTIWQDDAQLYISIKDFGCGIQYWQQWLVKLPCISFKKFGSGIGIPFAERVIKTVFKGTIRIHSVPKQGTEVICVLPLQ